MADFARMPTRQKVMVFAVIGLLLFGLYWQFVFKGLKEDLATAQSENASQSGLNKKLEKDIPEFQKLKTRMVTLKKIIDENQKALPTESELPAFFETLNRKVLESGVEVVRSRQAPEQKIETFVKVPIEYEIQGTFLQIKKFFASLLPKKERPGEKDPNANGDQVEERERIVSIENLSLTQPVVRNREIRLTARFVASTYRQEEKKEPAKPATPATPAKAGTPTPTGSGAGSAMAPSNTPTGARQRTEGAIEKGAQRNGAADDTKAGSDRMKGGL